MQALKTQKKHGTINNATHYGLVHPNTKAEPYFRAP